MRSYKEIRGILQERITSQQWQPGDLLPSEQALSEEFGCTRATVNRAMRELADAGWLNAAARPEPVLSSPSLTLQPSPFRSSGRRSRTKVKPTSICFWSVWKLCHQKTPASSLD
ncbi:GntR family transcriptional regulator [Pseudovibrio denitrificans]|uniref:GntR family transcriptional regulator n=1 Tax=Pseudovibrio denitrificans TaxID=258256 RepID=UPI001AD8EBBC|nr:GntR family transcriptional regulator [Pseudovibrio denitrificans]